MRGNYAELSMFAHKDKHILDRRGATAKVSPENVEAALRGLQERKLQVPKPQCQPLVIVG
jgi:hypothetical protein